MLNTISKRLATTFITFTLVLASGISSADDTEIFFNVPPNANVRPNLLFILDTSGSMGWELTNNTNPEAGEASRMEELKDAMVQILQEIEDVNVGLMRFTDDEGGPVLFPITYIDASVQTVLSETLGADPTYEEITLTRYVKWGKIVKVNAIWQHHQPIFGIWYG